MIKVKTGLVCVGLDGERNDLGGQFHEAAKRAFKNIGIEIVNPDSTFTLTGEDVKDQTEECLSSGAQSIVYLAGTLVYGEFQKQLLFPLWEQMCSTVHWTRWVFPTGCFTGCRMTGMFWNI